MWHYLMLSGVRDGMGWDVMGWDGMCSVVLYTGSLTLTTHTYNRECP